MQRAARCLIILLSFLMTGVRADFVDNNSSQIYNSFDSLLKPEEKAMSPVAVFHQCIQNRDHARVRQFVAAGIDINEYVSNNGIYYNALQFAVREGNFEAVKALVEAGADVNIFSRKRVAGKNMSSILMSSKTLSGMVSEDEYEYQKIYQYLKQHGAKEYLWGGYAKNAYLAYAVAGVIVIALGSVLFTSLICSLFKSCYAEVVLYICVGIIASLWVWYGPALLYRFFYIFK